jgi:glycosyltransferase involved in cell wall biosynthesis
MPLRAIQVPAISCVIPAFNEGPNLRRLTRAVLGTLAGLSDRLELIVVDDGSRDDTTQIMRALCAAHPEVVYIQLSRNFGKEAALTAGLEAARGEVVILMDADGQHPTRLLPEMLQHWREGADVVYAVRQTRADQSSLQAGLTGLFYRLVNLGSRVKIPANAGDFRLMDRRVVEALKRLPERNRFGLGGSLALALTGLLSFSTAPLRALTLIGLALSVLALGYGAWVVLDYFLFGVSVPGFATIAAGMMFFSGIQLLSIGILAEYVSGIFEEVKQRPAYLVNCQEGRGLGWGSAEAQATVADLRQVYRA